MKGKQIYYNDVFYSNAYVKVAFRGTKNADLSNKSCILLISVGKKYHEAERLEETIQLINRSGFSSCMIAVNDTLQRHNFIDMSDEDAYDYALRLGDEWLTRNMKYIHKLKAKTTIVRWQESLQHPLYEAYYQKLLIAYRDNPVYKNAIDSTANAFINRQPNSENADIMFRKAIEYLLEECPIIMPLWALDQYDYIIYPKPMTSAMSTTRDLFVDENHQQFVNWLSLKIQLKVIENNANVM